MTDPIEEALYSIYRDVLDHGMTRELRWTISGTHIMWLLTLAHDFRKKENLFGTIASHLSVLYGKEIRVPSIAVAQDLGVSKIQGTYSFLPADDGSGDWIIRLDVKDVSDEGEIIED